MGGCKIINFLTKAIRTYFVGNNFKFQFIASENPKILEERLVLGGVKSLHIYVHIPFCRHICPYCPYNKIPWDDELANYYFEALKNEIRIYSNTLRSFEIPSVYFGGGSPAISPSHLCDIVNLLKEHFNITGHMCLEINPTECTNETLEKLREIGINVISIGIQSFQDNFLNLIGRDYDGITAFEALKRTTKYFKDVNVDLMFTLPKQTIKELEEDLQTAIHLGAPQITVYPLFTFPYSTLGRYKKLKHVKMPNI